MYEYHRLLQLSLRFIPLRLLPSLTFPVFRRSSMEAHFEVCFLILFCRVTVVFRRWVSSEFPLDWLQYPFDWKKIPSNDSVPTGGLDFKDKKL